MSDLVASNAVLYYDVEMKELLEQEKLNCFKEQ